MADTESLGVNPDIFDVGNLIFYNLFEYLRGGQIAGGIGPVVRLQVIDNEIYPFHMMKKTVGVMGNGYLDLNFIPRSDLCRENLNRNRRFVGKDVRGREKEKSKKK